MHASRRPSASRSHAVANGRPPRAARPAAAPPGRSTPGARPGNGPARAAFRGGERGPCRRAPHVASPAHGGDPGPPRHSQSGGGEACEATAGPRPLGGAHGRPGPRRPGGLTPGPRCPPLSSPLRPSESPRGPTPPPHLGERFAGAAQQLDAQATGAPPPRLPYIAAGPPCARRLFQKAPEPSGRTLPNCRRGRAPAPAPWPTPAVSPRPAPNSRRARPGARLSAPARPGILGKVSRLLGCRPAPPPPPSCARRPPLAGPAYPTRRAGGTAPRRRPGAWGPRARARVSVTPRKVNLQFLACPRSVSAA